MLTQASKPCNKAYRHKEPMYFLCPDSKALIAEPQPPVLGV